MQTSSWCVDVDVEMGVDGDANVDMGEELKKHVCFVCLTMKCAQHARSNAVWQMVLKPKSVRSTQK